MTLVSRFRRLEGSRCGPYRPALEDLEQSRSWAAQWRDTAEGCGLVHKVVVPAGVTVVVPPIRGLRQDPGHPLTLVIEMLRGQHVSDYTVKADRLALALDAAVVVAVPRGGRLLGLELHDVDPLAEQYTPTLPELDRAHHEVILGRGEDGATVGHALASAAHIAVQGQNGSGKSLFAYALLAQAATAPDVLVAGSDITGLLLGRPWDGTRHGQWQATGTADLEAHAVVLERLVAVMDHRLAAMPVGVDKLEPTEDLPLVLVVVEEFPGLLRAAGGEPRPSKGERTLLHRITGANLRLLSEGRKVAFRVLTLAQRAEAEALGGGYARDQYALAVSFRVPADSLAMLHGDDARPLGAAHQTADPGIAVVSAPGRPLARVRTPYLEGEYREFCRRIGTAR